MAEIVLQVGTVGDAYDRASGRHWFDAPNAPAQALCLARHGMANFARQLNMLSDIALTHPSQVPGCSRAHVVAHVSIEARAQALILATLRGQPLEKDFDWQPDVDLTATLPPRALRHLLDHAHVHVNVEWRDLLPDAWSRAVTLPPSSKVDVCDLPARQAALLWWGAVALNAANTRRDIPAEVALPTGSLQAIARLPPHTPLQNRGI